MARTDGTGDEHVEDPTGLSVDHGPHAEFYRQAAQHFSAGAAEPTSTLPIAPPPGLNSPAVPPPPADMIDPTLGGDTGSPAAPQAEFRHPAEAGQGGLSSPRQDSDITARTQDGLPWVHRLMLRGTKDELIPQPWFRKAVHDNADTAVYVTYGGAFVITLLLNTIVSSAVLRTGLFGPSSILSMLCVQALWVGVGYVLLAIGTNLAHRFLIYGVCIVGTLVSLAAAWSAVSAISLNNAIEAYSGSTITPTGLLVFALMANVMMGVALIYLGIQVHRGIDRIPPRS